jgi:hypothetical protein
MILPQRPTEIERCSEYSVEGTRLLHPHFENKGGSGWQVSVVAAYDVADDEGCRYGRNRKGKHGRVVVQDEECQ